MLNIAGLFSMSNLVYRVVWRGLDKPQYPIQHCTPFGPLSSTDPPVLSPISPTFSLTYPFPPLLTISLTYLCPPPFSLTHLPPLPPHPFSHTCLPSPSLPAPPPTCSLTRLSPPPSLPSLLIPSPSLPLPFSHQTTLCFNVWRCLLFN